MMVILQWLPVDIAFTKPSMEISVSLKSSHAGVAVVTCLVEAEPRFSLAMSMALCLVQPSC
ncbi:hypothetical protein JY96_00660 [Aquabacterium sp. NJ1]|nr:hypothetical protein JY96_00660 [Aquabacterium sp. NJ1]